MRPRLPALVLLAALGCARAPAPAGRDAGPEQPAPSPAPSPAPPPARAAEGAPDVLVVVLDTTGTRVVDEHMPNTAGFLRTSRRFTRAVSPANSTMESVAAVFLGHLTSNARLWDAGTTTLPEALAAAGYRTFFGSANPVLDHPFYYRGFEAHHASVAGIDRGFPDRGVLEAFEPTWASWSGPKFAWLQLASCHDYRIARKDWETDGWARGAAALAEAWAAYVPDCAATDGLIPRLLAANAGGVTIVTADHGELFGHLGSYAVPGQPEHGHGHSDSPMEIEVPLGIAGPGIAQAAVDRPVSLVDLRSTILRLAGLPAAGGDLLTLEGLRPAVAASCNVHEVPTSRIAAAVLPDGSHVVRAHKIAGVPELFRWVPDGAGLRPHERIRAASLDDGVRAVLYGEAEVECVDDLDLCARHPEIASLGYVDCPQ